MRAMYALFCRNLTGFERKCAQYKAFVLGKRAERLPRKIIAACLAAQ